ncbi:MAG: endolytic transglycosylase MltG [Oleibacter sp.]|nr:endolytic transglycosylase MltG [Thalassolituus sp.]
MKSTIFKWLSLLLTITAFVAVATAWWLDQPLKNSDTVVIDIPRGATLNGLAPQWQDAGWLPSANALKLAVRLNPEASELHPGEYQLPSGLTTSGLLTFLATAKPLNYKLTLIEGRPLRDALKVLSQAEHLQQDLGELTPERIQSVLELTAFPEGQLYPDTYIYRRNEPVSSIIKQAHERLNLVLQEEWASRAENLPYNSPAEALIMASIVEKETGAAHERAEIAGVFVRRLQKGMRLETDPTVMYGLGADFDGNLRRTHLRDDTNIYNTYRNTGLPPTPIALAGRAAIHAALQPKKGDTLFFVARGDGTHQFSVTLSEHNRAVQKYQLQRRKDYRSAPQ